MPCGVADHSRESEVEAGATLPSQQDASLADLPPSTSLVINLSCLSFFGGALHIKAKQKEQSFSQEMSGWDCR